MNIEELPKISVVTPNFNQGRFLEETIQSVLSQGYPNLEYVIIDGGSTDNSIGLIKKYSHKLSYWVSEPDGGQYHAIQKGFNQCTGEVMTYINSDDLLSPGSLFTAAQVFTDYPFIYWLSGVPNQIDETGRYVSITPMPKWNRYRYLNLDYKYIQQEGVFWRRELWEKAGGSLSNQHRLAADLELWSRFFSHAQFYFLEGLTGSFRMRKENQKSLELLDDYHAEAEKILKSLSRSEKENRMLARYNSQWYQAGRQLPKVRSLSFFKEVEATVLAYPPVLKYNRALEKFILPNLTT